MNYVVTSNRVKLLSDEQIRRFPFSASGEFFKVLFDFCYKYKMDWLKKGFTTPLLDLIIYRNVRSLVGGKIRLMLSGTYTLRMIECGFLNSPPRYP
jgi:long-subunit acyl-CoA synthetase (AMP-forming)